MIPFRSAIKRPFSDIKTLLVAFILALFSFLIIPMLVLVGFAAQNASNSLENRKELPKWTKDNIIEYLKTGFFVTIIYIIYSLLGLLVLFFAFGSTIFGIVTGTQSTTAISGAILGGLTIGIIGLVLAAIGKLFAPMAVMNYIKTKKFGSAFALKKIVKKTLSKKYFLSLIIMIAYAIVLMIIGGILSIITLGIGSLLLPGIMAYVYMVTYFEVFAETFKATSN